MINEISSEIQASLDSNPNQLLRVKGSSPEKIYYVVTDQTLRRLTDESILLRLRAGLDDLAAGRVSILNPEDIKSRGRQRMSNTEK